VFTLPLPVFFQTWLGTLNKPSIVHSIFGKIGRIASNDVVLELIKKKWLTVLYMVRKHAQWRNCSIRKKLKKARRPSGRASWPFTGRRLSCSDVAWRRLRRVPSTSRRRLPSCRSSTTNHGGVAVVAVPSVNLSTVMAVSDTIVNVWTLTSDSPLSGRPIVWTGHPRKGPSGRLGGEHQALWSEGPWQGPGRVELAGVCMSVCPRLINEHQSNHTTTYYY